MTGVVIAVSAALLLWRSALCMEAALAAAAVFARSVLPALLPLMTLAEWSVLRERPQCSGFAGKRRLIGLLLFAFAAGSPAGVRRACGAKERLTERGARFLLVASGVMSPMFFTGTLASWLGDSATAACMLASHWASALLTGLLAAWRTKPRGDEESVAPPSTAQAVGGARADTSYANAPRIDMKRAQASRNAAGDDARTLRADMPRAQSAQAQSRAAAAAQAPPMNAFQALATAVGAASRSLVAVCGAMMLYAVMGALLAELLRAALPSISAQAVAVLRALLEIGSGAHAVCQSVAEPAALLCALCSFGGLSLWTQNLAFVGDGMRPAALLGYRAVHGALAYAVCRCVIGVCRSAGMLAAFSPSAAALAGRACSPLPACLALLALAAASWRISRTCSPRS